MATSELDIPEELIRDYTEYLYDEVSLEAGVAYEQLQLQVQAKAMGRVMLAGYMRSIFGTEDTPEETYSATEVQGVL